MDDTLNGEIAYVVLVSLVDAALLPWIAVSWYRSTVSRLMRAPAGAPARSSDNATDIRTTTSARREPLRIGLFEAEARPRRAGSALPRHWSRLAVAYAAGISVYAVL